MNERIAFAADLHLRPGSAEDADRFARFLARMREEADRLYLLGDLFDLWLGRASLVSGGYDAPLAALRETARAMPVAFQAGNRDFLFDRRAAPELEFLPDRHEIDLGGRRAHLTHGDLLCTDDRSYLRWRRIARSRPVRWLAGPLPTALATRLGRRARERGRKALAAKSAGTIAITEAGIAEAVRDGADTIICGHVHKRARRETTVAGRPVVLWTLGKWPEDPCWLLGDGTGLRFEELSEIL